MSKTKVLELIERERAIVPLARDALTALAAERSGMSGKLTTVDWMLVEKLLQQLLKCLDIAAGYERFLFTDSKDDIPQNLQSEAGTHATELLFLYKHIATLAEAVQSRAPAEHIARLLEHEQLISHIANEFDRLEPHLESLRRRLEAAAEQSTQRVA